MMTNERIEESLKNANLWYHSNVYFFGTIADLNVDIDAIAGNKKVSAKYLINLTENDIIIIPTIYSGSVEELFTEETISICSGDVEKVVVVPQNGYYYRLEVIKRDGEIIKIVVNLLSDDFQRKNIIKFVENFKNEGSETLFREELRPNFNNYANGRQSQSPLAKISSILTVVYIILFFTFVVSGIFGYSDVFEFFPLLIIGFLVIWFLVFASIISSAVKSAKMLDRDVNRQVNTNRPSFNKMSQEQREEAREKRNEDIITSSGPIVSDDENYGGIKKM